MSTSRRAALLSAILLMLTFAAYSNSFHNSFHFDDTHTIVNNLYIRTIANIPFFFKDSTTFSSLPSNQSYRPVVTATLAIDYWLGKGLSETFYFHLSMFIMFIMQGILMFLFYQKILNSAGGQAGCTFTALIAAGWYLLHPANAETINYIISRSDSFSALFIVLGFVLYVRSAFCRKWHLYLLPLALGMLTKPIAFVFPLLLLIYSFLFEEGASLTKVFSKKGTSHLTAACKRALPAFLFTIVMLVTGSVYLVVNNSGSANAISNKSLSAATSYPASDEWPAVKAMQSFISYQNNPASINNASTADYPDYNSTPASAPDSASYDVVLTIPANIPAVTSTSLDSPAGRSYLDTVYPTWGHCSGGRCRNITQ